MPLTSSTLVGRATTLVEAAPSYSHLTLLASALGAAGRFDEADEVWGRALSVYRDVSPFTLGWVSFTRGVMWSESAGRSDLALALYRDAVQRLPSYVVASTHLSELEDDAAAVARLEEVVDETFDPEPAGRLAERLVETDPARAHTLTMPPQLRYVRAWPPSA